MIRTDSSWSGLPHAAEHHRAEGQRADLEPGGPEQSVRRGVDRHEAAFLWLWSLRASWSSSTPSSDEQPAPQRGERGGRPGSGGRRGRCATSERHDAVVEHDHPVGQHDRLVDVVGDQQHRRAGAGRTARAAASCIRIRVSASSAPNGSSASSSCGSRTSERASAARCCSPPDSSCGQARSRPARPTSASACAAALRARPGRAGRASTLSSTRRHGSSRESWKTTDTSSGTVDRPVPGDVAVQPGQRPQQRALAGAAAARAGRRTRPARCPGRGR